MHVHEKNVHTMVKEPRCTAYLPCIPSRKYIGDSNVSRILPFLEFHEDLLEHIFYYVPTENLRSLREVNSTWKKVAETELRKRTFPTWIGCFYKPDVCVLEKGPNDGYSNSSLCIICVNNFSLNTRVCLHDANPDWIPFTKYIQQEIASRRTHCCALKCRSVSTAKIVHTLVPVIYQAIYLPVIPHIRSTMLYYSRDVHLCDEINNNEEIKCVLMFPLASLQYGLYLCFKNVPKPYFSKDAIVAGALISESSLFTPDHTVSGPDGRYPVILFLQEKGVAANFNVYTIVVCHAGDTPDVEFDRKVLKLKETADLRHCGIILALYHDIDINRIKNVFPAYTLLAFESYDQFGYDVADLDFWNLDSVLRIPLKRTVLVLMTWGKKV